MIDVCMGQYHCIQLLDCDRKRSVFFGRFAALPLKHPAVECDCVSVYVQKVARPGHLAGRTYERDFQVESALGYSAALKEDRKSLLVLRHQGGLPASATSFVEEIG